MSKRIEILLTNQNDTSHYPIKFEIFDTEIANKWLVELQEFIDNGQPFDDRERFYNFPNSKYTRDYVVGYINGLISTINNYKPGLIEQTASLYMGQDTLNYLHHIFEVYHGLYDQQKDNEFFESAPQAVKQALADLNIWIHRYESLGQMPRFVGTWYGKPSRKPLAPKDFEQFQLVEHWGDLKINYCEIGKNLFDLYHDNDKYIDKEAFKPLEYYSVDFTVRFTDKDEHYFKELETKVWKYFDDHLEFFNDLGYTKFDPRLSLGWITVGRIIETDTRENMIRMIGEHQKIENISIC